MCQGFRLQSLFLTALKAAIRKDQQYLKVMGALSTKEGASDPNFTIEKDLLLYKNRWYIPEYEGLRRQIMEAEHDSRLAGHFGIYKTIGRICANLYWPKMGDYITEYVCTCDTCQRSKTARHKKFGLLSPIEVPFRPCTSI